MRKAAFFEPGCSDFRESLAMRFILIHFQHTPPWGCAISDKFRPNSLQRR